MLVFTLAVLGSAALASCAGVAVIPGTQEFVNEDGRVAVFHGFNAVYKLPPYIPCWSCNESSLALTAADVDLLHQWGATAMRVGVLAEAVLPTSLGGAVNETYLGQVTTLVRRLGSAGIYSLLDAHQDDLSREFCGEGFPDFMIQPGNVSSWERFPSPLPVHIDNDPTTGYPNLTQCKEVPFALFNAAIEVSESWGGMYNNAEVRKHFVNHWQAVARTMVAELSRSNTTAKVLGYELLNEPVPYPLYDALKPGVSDRQNLEPLYNELYSAIRAVDASTIVAYEPAVTNLYLNFSTGFTTGPGGASDDDKQALAFHAYCNNLNSTGDEPDVKACDASLTEQVTTIMADSARVGGGRMMTEFGAIGSDSNDADTLTHLLDLADEHAVSWMYWNYRGYDDITTVNSFSESMFFPDGTPQPLKVKALSRSYPHLTPSAPGTLSFSFNHSSPFRELSVAYTVRQPDPSLPGGGSLVTELFGNAAVHYKGGANLTITPAGAGTSVFERDANGNWTGWVHVTHTEASRGQQVRLLLRAVDPQS